MKHCAENKQWFYLVLSLQEKKNNKSKTWLKLFFVFSSARDSMLFFFFRFALTLYCLCHTPHMVINWPLLTFKLWLFGTVRNSKKKKKKAFSVCFHSLPCAILTGHICYAHHFCLLIKRFTSVADVFIHVFMHLRDNMAVYKLLVLMYMIKYARFAPWAFFIS